MLDTKENDGIKIDILEYKTLRGLQDVNIAKNLYYLEKVGMSLKQVRITLTDSAVTTKNGALHFHKGNIYAECKLGGVTGIARKFMKSKLINEPFFTPTYSGTGEVFLEPSFNHFIIKNLENEAIIVEKNMFYCCESRINVGFFSQRSVLTGLLGGEDWFQAKLSGTGLCVLSIPIPLAEVMEYKLENERLQVDGNFVFLRSASLKFTVEEATRDLVGSITIGDGFLQTFEGSGTIWMAPTQSTYKELAERSHSSNTDIKNPEEET